MTRVGRKQRGRSLTAALLAGVMMLVLAACGSDDDTSTPEPSNGDGITYPEQNLRLAMIVSRDEPLGRAMQYFIAEVEERSGGAITIDFFPDGQLGGDTDVIEQVADGTVNIFATGFTPGTELGILFSPWLFTSYEQVDAVLQSEVGTQFDDALRRDFGVTMLDAFKRAPRHITSNGRPIETPADLAGFRMRVPEIPVMLEVFAGFNTDAVAMAFAEVYTALETGTISGQENPFPTIFGFSLQEVQEYLNLTYHAHVPEFILVSVEWWDGLDDASRTLMEEVLAEAKLVAAEETDRAEAELLDVLSADMIVVESDVAAFQELARATHDRIIPPIIGEESYAILRAIVDGS